MHFTAFTKSEKQDVVLLMPLSSKTLLSTLKSGSNTHPTISTLPPHPPEQTLLLTLTVVRVPLVTLLTSTQSRIFAIRT